MKRFGASILIASLLCLSCRSPLHDDEVKRAALTVSADFGASGAGRTVVPVLPEIPADLASITVSLASGDGYTAPEPQTDSDGPPWAVTFDAVAEGSWTVSVTAKNPAGVTIGTGSATCAVTADTPLTLVVPMVFSDVGTTGDVSFKISIPDSMGIDYVNGVLDGSATPQTPALTAAPPRSETVFAYSGLTTGTHTLVLTFKRGGADGTVAGIFREKIVVVGGYESASWIAADGTLADERAFAADEFYSPDAALLSLAVSADGVDIFPTVAIPFDSACLSYSLSPLASLPVSVTVSAIEKYTGQYLEYSLNGSAFAEITSNAATSNTVAPINALALRVTAADRATQNTYWVHFSVALPEGLGSYSVPGGTVTFTVSNGKINITGRTGNPTSVDIPATIGGIPVLALSDDAFANCTSLKTVTIPDSVTSIGTRAFCQCSGLTSVIIPDSVTSIGMYAFHSCSGLKTITIPNSVTSIGDYSFYGCSGLSEIIADPANTIYSSADGVLFNKAKTALIVCPRKKTGYYAIPNSVTAIVSEAFNGCTGLTSVTIPESVKSIGNYAFRDCSGLTSAPIPSSVTNIGSSAFAGCSSLTSVTIPYNVATIGQYAFHGCPGLTEISVDPTNATYSSAEGVLFNKAKTTLIRYPGKKSGGYEIPSSVLYISETAFDFCSGLTSVTIPNSVTSIFGHAFEGCSGLISVTIPDSVTAIAGFAFNGCSGLTTIVIHESVADIGIAAFQGCVGTQYIRFMRATPPSLASNAFYSYAHSKIFYVPSGSLPAYQAAAAVAGSEWSKYGASLQEWPY